MKSYVRLAGVMLFLSFTAPLFGQCDCITTGNCPVPITDNGTFEGNLDVTTGCDNDLGQTPLTQVCFQISHSWVGDLSVSLMSPGGDHYLLMADVDNGSGGCGTDGDNVDVCIDVGGSPPLTNNAEYDCVPGPFCLAGSFGVPCGGVIDPINGATEAPTCDLDDFNTPGQPVNGTWSLFINDVCDEDEGELINFTLAFDCADITCVACDAEGGSLEADDVTSCFGDPSLNINLPPVFNNGEEEPPSGVYLYDYIISQNGTIMDIIPTSDLTAQPPGVYDVCGLSYHVLAIGDVPSLIGMDLMVAQEQLASTTAPFCGDISNDCITVTIGNLIPPTVLDTFACLGECIFIKDSNGDDVEVCSSGDVVLTSYLGCDSVITVVLIPVFSGATNIDTTLCAGECMFFNNESYCPPGPHVVIFENSFGCDSIVTYTITEEVTEAIIFPDSIPLLSCDNPTILLDGSSSIPSNAEYNWSGPNGFTSNAPVAAATELGEYVLTIVNNNVSPPCTSVAEVTVEGNVTDPVIELQEQPPVLCSGEEYNLDDLEIKDTNNTAPTYTYHSATPANSSNELDTSLVEILGDTTFYVLAINSGNCTDETSVSFSPIITSSADFTVSTPICLTETSTVVYTGNGSADAEFTWNFGSGTAVPGTGTGPHSVIWPASGNKTITLTVTENGCTSDIFIEEVEVAPLIPQPVANCNPELNSIEFVWDPVPNASGYNITVAIGPTGMMTSDTSYLITGLNAGQQASIFIEAISDNSCPSSSVQITCTAQNCPDVTVEIEPFDDICLDGTQGFMPLSASQTGGDGSGVYTFSGTGVNAILGTFNPNFANIGPNNVLVTYEEGTCVYNGSTIINVYNIPSPDFSVTPSICSDGSAMVTYLGDASADANYTWDFGGGTATPGIGQGPHEIEWASGGSYTISLLVEENDCVSETVDQMIEVDTPLPEVEVVCDATTTSIEFFWNEIVEAEDYTVNVLTGQVGTMTSDTSILFDNLNPNTPITIEVVANNSGICGSSSLEIGCTANNCEPVDINIDAVNDICLDSLITSFDLTADIVGAMGMGQLTWSGDAITDTIAGTFDPAQSVFGENIVTATYTEGICSYQQEISIFIYDLPVATFTTNAPVCEGEEVMVEYNGAPLTGLTFDWDFGGGVATPGTGEGPHQVKWTDAGTQNISLTIENTNGCVSEVFESSAQIVSPMTAPIITCTSTPSSINFTWATVTGATDYQVEVLTGQIGDFTPPNSYLFENLAPNEEVIIELSVIGNGICPPVITEGSCIAINCPSADLAITPISESICISSSDIVDFELTVDGMVGAGVVSWSGDGITNTSEGIFDPTVAGIGVHTISVLYVDGNCSYQSSTTIEVIDQPSAAFSATPIICITDGAALEYLGNASATADYDWDFDGGIFDPATLSVSWDMPGIYILSLMVDQDGCVSQIFTQEVDVTPELGAPIITCEPTENSVEFNWADVIGALNYDVMVLSGHTGVYTPPGNYYVDGLLPGEEVIIEVLVNGNTACDLPVVMANCSADGCPDVILNLTPINPLCNDPQTPLIDLEANAVGGSGNGSGSWSGAGVVNGQFNASVAGEGQHILVYTYEESVNCIYTEEMTVEVVAPPAADAGPDGSLSCSDDEMEVELDGNGSAVGNNISYSWQADFGAFPGDSTILNPIVSIPGTYILTVTNTDLNCSSFDEVVVKSNLEVPVPDITLIPISCFGNNDGAIIVNSVEGGQAPYLYSLNGAVFGEASSFTQLIPGIYEVSVLDANGCENMLTFDIQQPQELNVELVVSIEGDNNIIVLGDELSMTGVVSVPDDSIDMVQWEPAELVECDTCLYTTSSPIQQTTFSITVESNGCEDSDAITIFVSKDRNVYVPTGFSPNGDNINDVFMVYADNEQAVQVKSFLVFNRWGESVYSYYDFAPNDPAAGWDGTFRNEKLNPGVYTWFAEIEFIDGVVEMFEGGVTLIR